MTNWLAALPLLFMALAPASACKAETEYKDDPQTLAALDKYKQDLGEKDGYIKQLEARIYDLEKGRGQGGEDEIVVAVTGDTLTITKGKDKGPNVKQGGPVAKDEELYKQFVDHVRKSRGSIQRCYTNALKKDSSLEVRSVTLQLTVRFKADGSAGKASFSPSISDAFSKCMGSVTQRWKLTGTSGSLTFKQPVTLSPQ